MSKKNRPKDKELYGVLRAYDFDVNPNIGFIKKRMNAFFKRNHSINSFEELKGKIKENLQGKSDFELNEEKIKLQISINYLSHVDHFSVAAVILSLAAICITIYSDFFKEIYACVAIDLSLLVYFITAYSVIRIVKLRGLDIYKISYLKLKLECIEDKLSKRAEKENAKQVNKKHRVK